MSNQSMNEQQKKIAYENAIAVIVDNFLHQLETKSEMVWNYLWDNERAAIKEWLSSTPDWNKWDGIREIIVNVKVLKLDDFKTGITAKAQEFGQRTPSEKDWERVTIYFEVSGSKVILQGLNKLGDSKVPGYGMAGMVAGSILPGVGNLVCGVIGGGVGAWRQSVLKKKSYKENMVKMDAAMQKAIQQVRENRQRIIDAILAHNY